MIEELTRKMNNAERTLLPELVTDATPTVTLGGTMWWSFLWCIAIVVCGILGGAMLAFDISPVIGGLVCAPIILIATVSFCAIIQLWTGFIHWFSIEKQFQNHDAPEIRRAIENGHVAVRKVTANAVMEIVEFEDEGAGYVFDVGDRHVLFLKGQRFITVSEDMAWPSTEFELVRTVIGNRWIGLFSYGSELIPVRTIATSDCREDMNSAEREELVQSDLESFAASLLA